VQLQKDLGRIKKAGLQVVGVSYDSVDVLSQFAKQKKIAYPLLSDADSKVIDAFKIRNKRATGRQNGIPHPATFVIDKSGVIRAKLAGTVIRRHSTQQLLDAAKELK